MVEFPPSEPVAWARCHERGWILAVRVQPGARRSEVVGTHGEELKVRVAAPPAEGRANAELVKTLAKWTGQATGRISVLRGHASRSKVVEILVD